MDPSFPICRYCWGRKPPSEFNAGHVIPQAFGKFEGNLVLHEMECIECNSYFGDHLELALARDTKEGLDRIEHGLTKPKKGGRRIASERLKFTSAEGQFAGASLELDPDAAPGELRLRPVRELGFGPSWDGPWSWFAPEDVPPLEELRAHGLHVVVVASIPPEELEAVLARIGLGVGERRVLGDPRDPDGKLTTTMHGRIDRTIKRAISKIAFGYLVHEYPGYALLEQFDEIRRYVRYDVEPSFDPIKLSKEPIISNVPRDTQLIAHVITVRWDARRGRVVAQVSLFGWLQYQVTLSNSSFVFPPTCIDSGHAFNPYSKQTCRLTRNRRLAGTLPLMSKEEFLKMKSPPIASQAAPSG